MKKGYLYIVATPIGNLSDISQRAIETLKSVTLIAAEDTRHSQRLLTALGINNRLVSLHDHNERTRSNSLVSRMQAGEDVALISDAGTPMISDPGYHLVRAAQEVDVRVVPIPGPSAVVSALSVSGLPANRFHFHGFLPEKKSARRAVLEGLVTMNVTLVFFESGKRVVSCLQDIGEILGLQREAVICRELTKLYESVGRDSVANLLADMSAGKLEQRGEFVLLIAGAKTANDGFDEQLVRRLLSEFEGSLPAGKLAAAISKAVGCPRKQVYQMVLEMKADG